MSFFINNAFAAAQSTSGASSMSSIIMLVGFVVIFYFLLWLPQSRRAKEHRNLVSNLAKDDEVITSGGLLGKINKVGDDFITLIIAEGVEVKVQKPAISATVPKGTFKSL